MEQLQVRESPRLSVNQFALYMSAPPQKRRRILSRGKFPAARFTAHYREALPALRQTLAGSGNLSPTLAALAELEAGRPTSPHDRQRRDTNARALNHALAGIPSLPVRLEDLREAPAHGAVLVEHGVTISVRPDVLVMCDGVRRGAGKIYLSVSDSLDNAIGSNIAWMVWEWLRRQGDEARVKDCWVYDVFAGSVYTAPRAVKARSKDFRAACREVADAWPNLTPED